MSVFHPHFRQNRSLTPHFHFFSLGVSHDGWQNRSTVGILENGDVIVSASIRVHISRKRVTNVIEDARLLRVLRQQIRQRRSGSRRLSTHHRQHRKNIGEPSAPQPTGTIDQHQEDGTVQADKSVALGNDFLQKYSVKLDFKKKN